jgi:hypothetical protein
MRQEYFDEGYEGAIVWGSIILFGSLALAGRFRRKMLDKRREAENRQLVRDTASASAHPPLPGKYWLNVAERFYRVGEVSFPSAK